jgi:hypothetical protein
MDALFWRRRATACGDGEGIVEAAGDLGMPVETLQTVYGHCHPDLQSRSAGCDEPRLVRLRLCQRT